MKVLGNSLLSKNFMYSNLLLSDTGLYYKVYKENTKLEYDQEVFENIFLTEDPEKIVELIGLKFEDVDQKEIQEVYHLLIDNPYFNVVKFFKCPEKCKSLHLVEFSKYLNENFERTHKEFNTLSVEELEKHFPLLSEQIEYSKEVLISLKEAGSKLSTAIKNITQIPFFPILKLNIILSNFNKSFPEKLDRSKYLHRSSVEEIQAYILTFDN